MGQSSSGIKTLKIYLATSARSEETGGSSLKELIKAARHKVAEEACLFGGGSFKAPKAVPDVIVLDLTTGTRGLKSSESNKTTDFIDILARLTTALGAPAVVVLDKGVFCGARLSFELYRAGALACLFAPAGFEDFTSALRFSVRIYEEIGALRAENKELKKQSSGRIAVERAKGLLMEAHNISEHDAYGRMRKMSMDTRRSMEDVAAITIKALKKSARKGAGE